MAATKTELSINNIDNEVDELHPILEELFRQMPDIVDFEYTHGNTEMGADFVLEIKQKALESKYHAAVIAKTGKIQQDMNTLERQISECDIPRFFRGGKEKIRTTEIWVVATNNITRNAQEKIHEKYRNRKIEFIDGKRLSKLIEQHLPNYWDKIPFEISVYLADTNKKNAEMDRGTSLLGSGYDEVYIEHDICEVPPSQYIRGKKLPKTKPTKIDIHDAIKHHKFILIEGHMGCGKSKLIRRLLGYYCDPETYDNTKIIPIATTLKQCLEHYNGDLYHLLEKNLDKALNADPDAKYLIMMDAFDEKRLSGEDQVSMLAQLSDDLSCHDNMILIITSRYLSGLDQTRGQEVTLKRFEILPLTLSKIFQFLICICEKINLKNRMIEDLKKSQLFKALPRNPMVAIILAKLLKENTEDIPSNMPELYQKYIEISLGRWDIDKGLQSQKDYEALKSIIMSISHYIIDHELVTVSIDEFKEFFSNYLKDRNLGLESDQLFEQLIDRTRLFSVNHGEHTIQFKHRSFAEYFYAAYSVKNGMLEIDNKAFELYWKNIYYFYFGCRKDCPEELEALTNLEPTSELNRWLKIFNMPNYYLAGYTTPYYVIEKGIATTAIEAARLYQQIASGESNSAFVYLPKMHVFYLFQIVFRDAYAFDFLKKAIESAALSISTGPYDVELKAYALFFLSVTQIDLGNEGAFDFLLNTLDGKLPLEVQLALDHEARDLSAKSHILKKQLKRVKKMAHRNSSLEHSIFQMYKRPISLPNHEGKDTRD